MKKKGAPILLEIPALLEETESPVEFLWSSVQPRILGYSMLFVPIIEQIVFSKQRERRRGAGCGKKNDLESLLLIIVPGKWKTEFPFWSNYSLVYLMKPNHGSFHCLAKFQRPEFHKSLALEENINFLHISYHLPQFNPQKNLYHFSNMEGK